MAQYNLSRAQNQPRPSLQQRERENASIQEAWLQNKLFYAKLKKYVDDHKPQDLQPNNTNAKRAIKTAMSHLGLNVYFSRAWKIPRSAIERARNKSLDPDIFT